MGRDLVWLTFRVELDSPEGHKDSYYNEIVLKLGKRYSYKKCGYHVIYAQVNTENSNDLRHNMAH